jgi:hypothetical protein
MNRPPKLLVDSCVVIDSFQKDSAHREDAYSFLDYIVRSGQLMTMPAHGWFEVWCNLNRLSTIDRRYAHPAFGGQMALPLELIHIDKAFITKYGNIRLPYMKGSDHIFVVVAHVNNYQLVTRDDGMLRVCREIGVRACSPAEYLSSIAASGDW